MHRIRQILLIVPLLLVSWLGMMVVHECGHVLHGWWSSGSVEGVLLHPLKISMTSVHPNPHPLFVVWGGPIWGCILPTLLLGMARLLRPTVVYLFRFFAGFCLVANGIYIAFLRAGDPVEMLRRGCPEWGLYAFGLPLIAVGFLLWNGQSHSFGFGDPPAPVSWQHVAGTSCVLAAMVILELALYRPV